MQESTDRTEKVRRKPLPATYEPGQSSLTCTCFFYGLILIHYVPLDKRTLAWLKLKKDYVLNLGDSLDLVPIGAWHGNGRKAQWWSPILLAVWDPDSEKLVAVCKCMSGTIKTVHLRLIINRQRFKVLQTHSTRSGNLERSPGNL